MDGDRVLDGSPWMVGKHAVLLKVFDTDTNIQPLQVEFKTLYLETYYGPAAKIDES